MKITTKILKKKNMKNHRKTEMVTSLESRIWIRPPPIKLQCSQHKQKEAILERELQMKQNTTKVERNDNYILQLFISKNGIRGN